MSAATIGRVGGLSVQSLLRQIRSPVFLLKAAIVPFLPPGVQTT